MKPKGPIALFTGWLALALAPTHVAHAADGSPAGAVQQTGTISGRVQNVATGQYLNNARVSVKGTEQITFTNEFGNYRINNVRSGPVVLEIFYTDLDVQEIPLNVPAGAAVERNVELTNVARYGQNGAVVKLDPFVVATTKEMTAEAVATNEQRFAPNIKNVISTDALGVMMVGGAGEFLKFVPGITAEYTPPGEVQTLALRGLGPNLTSVSTDGVEMVSAAGGVPSRSFVIKAVSLNDISRIEVTKVPTPAMPADSLGGSINLIRKSAFEKDHAELQWGVMMTGTLEDRMTLKRQPQMNGDKMAYYTLPGFDFSYSKPFGKNFGIVATVVHGYRYSYSRQSRNTFNNAGTGTGASASKPYLQSYTIFDGGANLVNTNLSLKADWRVTPNSVLSFGGTYNPSKSINSNSQFAANAGTVATSTIAGGVPFSSGPDFTTGATGRGAVTTNNVNQTSESEVAAMDVKYRFDNGTWKIDGGLNGSSTFWKRVDDQYGSFFSMATAFSVPVRVSFSNINATRPGAIDVFDNNNQRVDPFNLSNYLITGSTLIPMTTISGIRSGHLNLRRQLGFLPFPAALQVGGSVRIRIQDNQQINRAWNYNGADGNSATTADQGAATFRMQNYVNRDPGYGFPTPPWASVSRAYAAWQTTPALFSQTAAQIASQEDNRLLNSEFFQETVNSYYLQGEANLLNNRLKVVTGIRYEKTASEGEGSLFDPNAVFVRNADGTFARNAAGARIRKPEAGAAGSLEQVYLTRKERAAHSSKKYDGFYPSLHFTFNARDNLLVRLAYARTYGRPNFADIVPRTTVSEADLTETQLADPSVVKGTLTVRNPSLMPWTADNYDLSAEYYTDQGGFFSAGIFDKEIKNFFGDISRLATAADLELVGLDPRYLGWNLITKFNAGDARISGAEFNFRHGLRPLGKWGSYFTVFANVTRLRLEGNQGASFVSFIPLSGNWGGTFAMKRFSMTARWNYRGADKRTPLAAFDPDGYEYFEPRTFVDLSFSYQMTRRLSLVATVNNALHSSQKWERRGSLTPEYAKQFQDGSNSSMVAIGIKGRY